MKALSKSAELFIAGAISSLALFLFEKKDVRLLKLFFYPRVLECIWKFIKSKYYKQFYNEEYNPDTDTNENGKTVNSRIRIHVVNVFVLCAVVYIFIFEPFSMEKAFNDRIGTLVSLTPEEKQMFDSWGVISKELIKQKYPNHRFKN